jgi:hypothetical protein
MKRREFFGLIAGGIAWPTVGAAQERLPLIGFLSSRSSEDSQPHVAGVLGRSDTLMARLQESNIAGLMDSMMRLENSRVNW